MSRFAVVLALLFGLFVGCAGGFVLGIASTKGGSAFLSEMVTSEAAANVRAPKSMKRGAFELEYPGNWKIDEADEDYDPDHLFSIESPGSCHVSVVVFDSVTEAQVSVDAQVKALVPKIVKDPSRTPFDRWGRFEGAGVKLEGKILGINQGNVRIFAHASEEEDVTFTIVEFCYDEDMADVRPGFELLERTFELR